MENTGAKKTIQINNEFLKINKKGSSQIKKTQNKPKKQIGALKKNTIKRELAKKIQEKKQQEIDEIHQKRVSMEKIIQGGTQPQSELNKSLSYLNEFVKNKKRAKKKNQLHIL